MNNIRNRITYAVILAGAPMALAGCVGFGVAGIYTASGKAVASDVNSKAVIESPEFVAAAKIVNTQSGYGLYGFIIPIIPVYPSSDLLLEIQLDAKSDSRLFVPGSLHIQSEGGVQNTSEIRVALRSEIRNCAQYLNSTSVIRPTDWDKSMTIDGAKCFLYLFHPRPPGDFSVMIKGFPTVSYNLEYQIRGGIEGLAP